MFLLQALWPLIVTTNASCSYCYYHYYALLLQEALLLVQNEKHKQEYTFISWLTRCYIMNGNPRNAWELYLKMETSNESFNLLQLIANDCYRMGHFLHSAKLLSIALCVPQALHCTSLHYSSDSTCFYTTVAFDVLERLDPDPEYWEGKRGACVGVFQQVIAGKANKDDLRDVLGMVRNTSNPQVEYMVRVIKKWCKDNGMKIA
eukprot:20070-Heterococcus_DN1.PRE.3